MRIWTLLWLGILGAMVAGLFQVKYEVQKLESTLADIRKDNDQIRESIGILRAEWGYLNRPERITRLSEPLGLVPVSNEQLADFESLPRRFDRIVPPALRGKPVPTPPHAIPRRPAP